MILVLVVHIISGELLKFCGKFWAAKDIGCFFWSVVCCLCMVYESLHTHLITNYFQLMSQE